jgi:zinc protease
MRSRPLAAALAVVLASCASAPAAKDRSAPAAPAAALPPAWQDLPPELAKHPDQLKIGTLQFRPQQPEIFTLKNGLTVYHLEDRTVPLVSASLMVEAGAIYEPPEQVGLASMTAQAMRAGGAGKLNAQQLDDRLATLAASLELGAGDESSVASLSVRSQDAMEGLSLLADVVQRPRFDPGRVQVLKLAEASDISRRGDDPGDEAWRAFKKAIYGPTSPWARESSQATLARIDVRALQAWHDRYYQPGVSRLVITGAISREEASVLAEKFFGAAAWPARDVVFPDVPKIPREITRRVILVPRDIPQAKVRIGHLGFTRHDPQEYAIRLADSVLGGAMFVSRLAREIRSNRGLAYGIASSTTPGRDVGIFAVYADTRSAQVKQLVDTALQLVAQMGEKPDVSKDELALARDLFVNQFAFRFDTARKAAMERATFDFYGYPPDYLPTFPERISAVTAADVDAASKRIFDGKDAVIVIVGDPAQIGDLAQLGKVEVIRDVDAWK